jgi:hypothetical protein
LPSSSSSSSSSLLPLRLHRRRFAAATAAMASPSPFTPTPLPPGDAAFGYEDALLWLDRLQSNASVMAQWIATRRENKSVTLLSLMRRHLAAVGCDEA